MKSIQILIFAVITVLISCTEDSGSQDILLTKTYSDPVNNFSIKFPSDWTILNNHEFILLATGPLNGDTLQNRKDVGVGLDIKELESNIQTNEFYIRNLNYLKSEFDTITIIKEDSLTIDGKNARSLIHEIIIDGRNVKSITIYLVNNKKGYTFNGSAANEIFDSYKDLFLSIAKSFQIKEK